MSVGHMVEAAEEEDAIAAAARDKPATEAERVPPQKNKVVKAALKHVARKDPPRDVFKPIGRGSFLIWVVIVAGLVWAAGGPQSLIERPPWNAKAWERSQTTVVKTYEGLTGTPKMRNKTINELGRSPRKMSTLLSVAFLAVTGVFAAYYATIYLVGVPLMKGTVATGRALHRHVLKPAGKALARARARRRARALAAGAEPKAT